MNCIHRNGDITGYSVRYMVQGSTITQYVNISGGATFQATIFGAGSGTAYTIEVAAISSAGVGVYSIPTVVSSSGVV